MGKTTKQPSDVKKHLKHHEYPNEYEFETFYTHQSDDKNVCQTLTLNSVVHSRDIIGKKELEVLGLTWLHDLPKAIEVGDDQLWRPLSYPLYIKYTYVNKDGNRVYGDWKVSISK